MSLRDKIGPIRPMLARSSPPFDSEKHIFELKWDGTRCIAFIDRDNVIFQNRRLIDISYRYPEFQKMRCIKAKELVLDGELVVLREGLPDFEKLQQREHTEDRERIRILSGLLPATYIVFDLLYINGVFLMGKPLMERKDRLHGLFPFSDNVILSETYSKGRELFKKALKIGFEGIMAKEKESPYLPGERSGYWLKIKKFFDIDAVVCGYTEGEGERKDYFGSLILGVYDNRRLIHIGQVGTGIDERMMRHLFKILKDKKIDRSPFDTPVKIEKNIYWCRPEIVVRVSYHELTKDKKMRIPVFKGIRLDKSPEECTI